MESVFGFDDYRAYLRGYYQEKKRLNPGYSLRVLAERCGFKARDYLLRVMKGEKNLSPAGAARLSEYFRFSEKQAEYFQTLVLFNQARTVAEKERFYAKLSEIQKYGRHQRLRGDQYEYLSSWHHIALRSLLPVLKESSAPDKIGQRFDPPLTAKQVSDSIDLLMRLGLLQPAGKGRYTVGEAGITTGDEIASLSVAQFHKTTMELARRSIDRHPPTSRDISGLTMSLSQAGFRRIKEEIRAFRKKVMAIAVNDKEEDMVYQLNMHLFPLTKARGYHA